MTGENGLMREESGQARPMVTILIPVYNEATTIERVLLATIRVLGQAAIPFEIMLLDDGSRDWTEALRERVNTMAKVTVRTTEPRRGKGMVVGEALPLVITPFVAVMDGDDEYSADDLPAILAPLLAGTVDWVLGSRYGYGRPRPPQYVLTYLVNVLLNHVFRMLFRVKTCDFLTGLYALRVDLTRGITITQPGFSFIPEFYGKVINRHPVRWLDVPVSYRFRTYGSGKKIRWWETFTILLNMLKYRPSGRLSNA